MNDLPAIALIEFRSVAAGAFATDAMVKQADLRLFEAGTVQPGKYLVLIGGLTANVEACHRAGIRAGAPEIIDDVLLADAHASVVAAIRGTRDTAPGDSVLTLETSTTPAIVRAADAAVKGSRTRLAELRLADGLGGKGIAWLLGERADVEAAADIAASVLAGRPGTLCHSIISRVHEDVARRMATSTRFDAAG